MRKLLDLFKALFFLIFFLGGLVVLAVKLVQYLKKHKPELIEEYLPELEKLETAMAEPIKEFRAAVLEPAEEAIEDVSKEVKVRVAKVQKAGKRVQRAAADLSERQQALLNLVRRYEKASMNVFKDEVKGVTERTLRRDLAKLESAGLISKRGSTKSATYKAL